MKRYNRKDEDFNIPRGISAILGFQQVLTSPDKVFIWMREEIIRPSYQDRHRTTRMANNSLRKIEWGKSVWKKEHIIRHLGSYLQREGITEEHLKQLEDDSLSDKWVTNGDGERNFLKCIITFPKSDITGEPFRIQVTQTEGIAPESIYTRAYNEYMLNFGDYQHLLTKYKNKALIKTYAPSHVKKDGIIQVTRKLAEVFVKRDGKRLPVYEESEIVLGEPDHKFIKYEIPNDLPLDILDKEEINSCEILDITNGNDLINIKEKQLKLEISGVNKRTCEYPPEKELKDKTI